MSGTETYAVINMLASRAFHDMAGPASALQNGISFLDDADLFETARKHLEESAVSLNQRLEFFRLLMGRRTADQIGWEAIRRICVAFMGPDQPVKLIWPDEHMPSITGDSAAIIRSVLCLFLVSSDVLSRGGEVRVEKFDNHRLDLWFIGAHIETETDSLKLVSGLKEIVDVTPRTAPAAWVAACQAEGVITVTVDLTLSSESPRRVLVALHR